MSVPRSSSCYKHPNYSPSHTLLLRSPISLFKKNTKPIGKTLVHLQSVHFNNPSPMTYHDIIQVVLFDIINLTIANLTGNQKTHKLLMCSGSSLVTPKSHNVLCSIQKSCQSPNQIPTSTFAYLKVFSLNLFIHGSILSNT